MDVVADKFREETLGTVDALRTRAAEMERIADACEAEAREQVEAVERLRARAEGLRVEAMRHRYAANVIEKAPAEVFEEEPT